VGFQPEVDEGIGGWVVSASRSRHPSLMGMKGLGWKKVGKIVGDV
jgi:hypothetical protein